MASKEIRTYWNFESHITVGQKRYLLFEIDTPYLLLDNLSLELFSNLMPQDMFCYTKILSSLFIEGYERVDLPLQIDWKAAFAEK